VGAALLDFIPTLLTASIAAATRDIFRNIISSHFRPMITSMMPICRHECFEMALEF